MERRLNELGEEELAKRGTVNQRYISLTDAEATLVGRGKPRLYYQAHRAVDPRAEIITATCVRRGDQKARMRCLCELRAQCTRNKAGRSIKRHWRQEALDAMRSRSRSPQAKRDIRTRQHLMERSFARGTRFGFDHARWRGRNQVQIQEYLSAAIQNIEVLIRYGGDPRQRGAALQRVIGRLNEAGAWAIATVRNLLAWSTRVLVSRDHFGDRFLLTQP